MVQKLKSQNNQSITEHNTLARDRVVLLEAQKEKAQKFKIEIEEEYTKF